MDMLERDNVSNVLPPGEEGNGTISAEELEYIRSKTFNSELGDILGQIMEHEKQHRREKSSVESSNDGGLSSREKLLHKIEQLIYKVKFESEGSGAGVLSFNPFIEDVELSHEGDNLKEYVAIALKQAGLSDFALLKYGVNQGAFIPHLSLFGEDFNANFCLGFSDNLFKEILDSPRGSILKSEEIVANPYLTKLFGETRGNFYFVKVAEIYQEAHVWDSSVSNSIPFAENLSPLLVLKMEDENLREVDDIFNLLAAKGAIPLSFYFEQNRFSRDLQEFSYETTLEMVNLFPEMRFWEKVFSIDVYLVDYSRRENMFLFKYLLDKLKKLLRGDEFMVRISIDRAIIMPHERDIDSIVRTIDEFREITGHIVDFKILDQSVNV